LQLTTATNTNYAAPRRHRLNVLLISDAPDGRSPAEQRLGKSGHAVVRVSRPHEAARAIHYSSISLVLFETLGDSAGFHEFLAAIRGGQSGRVSARYTPVYALEDPRGTCENLSQFVDHVLPSPLNVDTLTATYLEFLTESAARMRRGGDVEPCCEIEAAIERLGGDVELFKDLVDRFLDDSAGTRRKIEMAVESRDGALLHGAAHSLKGLAASCGAVAAADALAELESLGRACEFAQVPEAWSRFQAEMESTAEALAPYHRRQSGGGSGPTNPRR
jgi:HPt (histidine-containing phosphotransfer) domain-containing protein